MTYRDWDVLAKKLTFAFQPIVNIHTGACAGVEALLRGWDHAGFDSIYDVFDRAHEDRALHSLDLALRRLAIEQFLGLGLHDAAKLFFNVDSRVLEMPDYRAGATLEILQRHGLAAERLCLEISERHNASGSQTTLEGLNGYRSQSFRVALDDFGAGYSGLQLLYNCQPDYIKIDRFFIEGVADDHRKRVFVQNVVSIARLLGISVVAEGVETEAELCTCRDIGCDLAQGFFVQEPTQNRAEIVSFYPSVHSAADPTTAMEPAAHSVVLSRATTPAAVRLGSSMSQALGRFRTEPDLSFLVVVNAQQEPLGVLRESTIKPFIFSPYGWALLGAREGEHVDTYISRCPSAEIHCAAKDILNLFSGAEGSHEGVILTDNGRYAGFLSAAEIVKLAHERDVETAREANPLTRLPGNRAIGEYLRRALNDTTQNYSLVYLDFDDFKTFNDAYGFRRGDRAIQMFAQRLRQFGTSHSAFVGHIGGDDFFVGTCVGGDRERFAAEVTALIDQFRADVRSLYSDADLERGGVLSRGREGEQRLRPLMGISAAILYLPAGTLRMPADELGSLITALKVAAKKSPSHLMMLDCRDLGVAKTFTADGAWDVARLTDA